MNLFYTNISFRHIFSYFTGRTSLFRKYQTEFIQELGPQFSGKVIELGGEKKYNHYQYFANADSFICSNVNRDYDMYLDITNMKEFEDESVENFICLSVFEHLKEYQQGISEIFRVLRPGGKLLFTVPFLYPYHDEIDYWRFTKDGLLEVFNQFEIIQMVQLGGLFSTLSDFLQRPKGNYQKRYFVYKLIGFFIAFLGHFLDTEDSYPLGYGLYAIKK